MIKRLLALRETLRIARLSQSTQNGYGWAWAAWRIGGHNMEEIAAQAYASNTFSQSAVDDAFDQGVLRAVLDMEIFLRGQRQ